MFSAQVADDKYYRHARMDWHTNSMPAKEKDHSEGKYSFRKPNGTDSAEINHYSHYSSSYYFDRLSFQVEIEKKQTPFLVTILNTVHTAVFTNQPNSYDWINSIANSQSRCKGDSEYLIDNSWS